MKRILFLMVLLLLFFTSSTLAALLSPKLIVSPGIVEIGKTRAGQILERELILQNRGDSCLIINSITSDCPCTSLQIPDKDGNYQPLQSDSNITLSTGENVKLKLIFDSNKTKYRGKFKKLIVISSNDPETPLMRVEMEGDLSLALP